MPSPLTPSFVYSDSEESAWTSAQVQWFNNSVLKYTDNYANPTDQTDFSRTLGPGFWTANVSVCDAGGCAWNMTQQVIVYNTTVTLAGKDILDSATISSFSATDPYTSDTWSTTTGSLTLYPLYDDTNFSFVSDGYENKSEAISFTDTEVYLTPYLNFTILREATGTKLDVNETDLTKMTIYCPTKTMEYEFNITANDNTLYIPVDCQWTLIKLDLVYGASSYYRTLVPDYSERNIVWYAADLLQDLAVQVILSLNDLIGDYVSGYAIIKKSIGGTTETMIEQQFDVENKVVLYLLKDNFYTLTIRSSSGAEERSLGFLIADAAGTKTITIPNIDYVPESYLGQYITWDWTSNTSLIKLTYSDTSTERTDNLTYTVYNGSNVSQVIYTTLSTNISTASFTYVITDPNSSYVACFEAWHSVEGEIKDCNVMTGKEDIGDFSGWDADDEARIKQWFSVILIIFMMLVVGRYHATAGLGLGAFFMFMFMHFDWLDIGTSFQNYSVLSITVLITVLSYWWEENRR